MAGKDSKKAIAEYRKQRADEILKKMYAVLVRAQRKIDDMSYRKILGKLEK